MKNILYVSPAVDLQVVFDSVQPNSEIYFAPGIYRQKTMIRTSKLTLIGSGAGRTVLVFDDHASKAHPIGGEYNTFRTYTLAVCADDVTIRDLSVVNDALCPEQKGQEVALSVVADGFRMENCTLTSTQDTLFLGPLPSDLIGRYEGAFDDALRQGYRMRQRFQNCRIEGTVDFIFGCGEAELENCEIRSLKDARHIGYVAAPAHGLHQEKGLTFRRCCFTREAGVEDGSIFLARPWRDYGIAEFIDCSYGPHIASEGFDKWNGTHRDQTARFREYPVQTGRVDWINRK